MKRSAAILFALLTTVVTGLTFAQLSDANHAVAIPANNVYGIDDANVIYEINPDAKTFEVVNETGLAGTSNSNSMAYDSARDQFFFLHTYVGGAQNGQTWLLMWDRQGTGPSSLRQVASGAQLGTASAGTSANASFYNGAFWFFESSTSNILKEVKFSYSGSTPSFASVVNHDLSTFAAPKYPARGYGDIAITSAGMLYGSQTNGRIFKVDLTLLSNTSNVVYTEIVAPPVSGGRGYQLSFDPSFTTLYGHYHPDASWYTIDLASGAVTSLNFASPTPPNVTGFRDVGGASITNAPVPDIEMTKTVTSTGPYTLGTTIRWQLTATNTGSGNLNNVTISEQLPGVATVDCSPAAPATLTPGATMTCAASHVVTQADVDAGQVANTATASGEPATPGYVTVTDSETVTTQTSAALADTGQNEIVLPITAVLALLLGGAFLATRRARLRA